MKKWLRMLKAFIRGLDAKTIIKYARKPLREYLIQRAKTLRFEEKVAPATRAAMMEHVVQAPTKEEVTGLLVEIRRLHPELGALTDEEQAQITAHIVAVWKIRPTPSAAAEVMSATMTRAIQQVLPPGKPQPPD